MTHWALLLERPAVTFKYERVTELMLLLTFWEEMELFLSPPKWKTFSSVQKRVKEVVEFFKMVWSFLY
jgi:hypothetical protein